MEQHKLVRIPVILKGPNYITWSRLTRTALGGRGLWEHITTSEAPRQITQGEDGKEVVVVDEGKWGQEDLMTQFLGIATDDSTIGSHHTSRIDD
ncbi:hypothetical protein F2Q69_00017155 [Brassica cretica]|uniref:Retrotransposon Copia-like N-terminal domain-containing protein n=1 Tax=Brassica cretica TaxID=69181 RepID=A0A8S9R5F9_BRACR|nr:hypothetical protein F2Q69_00017155 [Brassica cretica]